MNKYDLVYKTKVTPFFPICLVGKNYSANFKKLIGLDLIINNPIVVIVKEGFTNWFFPRDLRDIGISVLDKFLSDSKYINKVKKREKEISNKLFKEIRTPIKNLFFRKNLNQKGQNKLKRIFKYYSDYGYSVDLLGFLFQLYYIEKIKKNFSSKIKGNLKEKNEIFNLILSSHRETNYEKFLGDIYNFVNNEKGTTKYLQKIVDNYYWLIHDYLGDIIDQEYILKFAKKFQNRNLEKLKLELESIKSRIKDIKCVEKQLSEHMLEKVNIVQDMLYLYNERKKEVLNKTNIYIRNIIEYKFPNKNLSELHKIYQLPPLDIINLLSGESVSNFNQRSREWVYLIANGKIKNGDKKYIDLIKIFSENVEILRGVSASSGKVSGLVDIVLNISHISKFKAGNILVAPFTTVSYLPAMREAMAILTETGGLTSHAAIMARELKIPCIVGIKNLISILKDGDLVEVDADKGIIKIIK